MKLRKKIASYLLLAVYLFVIVYKIVPHHIHVTEVFGNINHSHSHIHSEDDEQHDHFEKEIDLNNKFANLQEEDHKECDEDHQHNHSHLEVSPTQITLSNSLDIHLGSKNIEFKSIAVRVEKVYFTKSESYLLSNYLKSLSLRAPPVLS